MKKLLIIIVAAIFISATDQMEDKSKLPWLDESKLKMEKVLTEKYGDEQKERIALGLKQVADFWRAEDGNASVFEAFVEKHFASDQKALDVMFDRFSDNLEKLDGHMLEILLKFRWQSDLEIGPLRFY